ncbi:hypothetical protein L202_04870 [Cryptococcus amylolentus CBS 6039]|uniref:Mitochondrial carrier protein n=2 Tax=Cryptococcus amylolentus CBS 6039 TaxID=1295533 RepID=A0A1E3HN09_9TREE|nr:hypothetical protein L202_04870 [Cryptococcus amylolentus CBS 6039]ODN77728.1 hypothetical protein L202_04870 [Cryptococcus amylolentus CBS 6039]
MADTSAQRRPPYQGVWTKRAADADEWLHLHKVVVSATSASLISTFTGFPLDSLKSRLQSSREKVSIPRLAAGVIKEEGIGGLWRGFPLPLVTISIVRTISFTIYSSTKRILNAVPALSDASRQSEEAAFGDRLDKGWGTGTGEASQKGPEVDEEKVKDPWIGLRLGMFSGDNAKDIAITSMLAGGASGAVVCVGSAPFELVKVRRQLEYQIYRDSRPELRNFPPTPIPNSALPKGTAPFQPPTTIQAVRLILASSGPLGLYTGWRLHFIRDTLGTALYFAEYDVMRYYLGRAKKERRDGEGGGGGFGDDVQGDVPEWCRGWIMKGMIPFLCGSLAGVTSWALIYPVDAIKTKAQQRALSGLPMRTPIEQLSRLVRGTDKSNPKPFLTGMARLYRGLGISMIRSMLTHGLLWTLVDATGSYIDSRPFERLASRQELK